jgi:hypothetical protein
LDYLKREYTKTCSFQKEVIISNTMKNFLLDSRYLSWQLYFNFELKSYYKSQFITNNNVNIEIYCNNFFDYPKPLQFQFPTNTNKSSDSCQFILDVYNEFKNLMNQNNKYLNCVPARWVIDEQWYVVLMIFLNFVLPIVAGLCCCFILLSCVCFIIISIIIIIIFIIRKFYKKNKKTIEDYEMKDLDHEY